MRDPRLADVRVLLVDDNEHTLTLVTGILRSLGVGTVRCAGGALEALKVLRGEPIDVLISDLYMDPVDGFTLVDLIRTAADSPNPKLPIIVLSGHDDESSVAGARKAGANGYVTKPVSPQALYQHLLRCTGVARVPARPTVR